MKTALPQSITSIDEAEKFLSNLFNNGEAYHCEDDAFEVVWNLPEQPTSEEKKQLNKLMEDISSIEGFDPCGYILSLDGFDTELN